MVKIPNGSSLTLELFSELRRQRQPSPGSIYNENIFSVLPCSVLSVCLFLCIKQLYCVGKLIVEGAGLNYEWGLT